jgi:hypothetical protein
MNRSQVTVLGDVCGWVPARSWIISLQHLLGYKVKSKWTLEAGHRYLFVD